MQTTIDTIGDVIFNKKEDLKKLNVDREDLIRKLCSKQAIINEFSEKIARLEMERRQLQNNQASRGADCQPYANSSPGENAGHKYLSGMQQSPSEVCKNL